MTFKLLYQNFDGFDVSYQGALPEHILSQLSSAKTEAQNEKRDVLATLGPAQLKVMVAESGSHGGYRYRFDTGPDGETWFIAHSSNSKNWNIRVSVKSLALALHGYEGVKERIKQKLTLLQVRGASRKAPKTGEVTNQPLERISRVDYCYDFLMPEDFNPDPRLFIAHQRTKKHIYAENKGLHGYSSSSGDKVNTIRLGSMPGRQIVLYNKTKEILASHKKFWWKFWGVSKEQTGNRIWRLEVRAGKDELNKWPLKTYEDFEEKIGDVMVNILNTMRYVEPLTGDENRSRWPMAKFWQYAIDISIEKSLKNYSSNALRENVLRDYRETIVSNYRNNLIGNAIGLTAAMGYDAIEYPIALKTIEEDLKSIENKDFVTLLRKYQKALERYKFL